MRTLFYHLRLFIILGLCITNTLNAQTFWSEDFETDGNGSRYTPEVEVRPSGSSASCNDYFARSLATDQCSGDFIDVTLGTYTGLSGSYLWAAEDLDDNGVGGSQNFELFITFDNIPSIAGKSNLAFRGIFGAGATDKHDNVTAATTNPDFMIVEYQIDGGGFQPVLSFHAKLGAAAGTFNTPLAEDTDGDNIGDGADLTNAMQTYTALIPGTGNSLDLRIRVSANSANEEMAFDFFELLENFILPVELVAFEGKAVEKGVQLSWSTATETNNAGFELQKSYDAKDWETIAFVEGRGNSNVLNSYAFEDQTAVAGTNYYRLKQLDFDGAFEYSEVVAVEMQEEAGRVLIFPNPSSRFFTVSFKNPSAQPVELSAFNSLGQLILSQQLLPNVENQQIELLEAGTYVIRVQIGPSISYHRVIIQL